MNSDETAEPTRSEPQSSIRLTWPPPGLEEIHGKLPPLTAGLAIADFILILPLLVSVGVRREFTSLGPFGSSWWIILLTTATGFVIAAGFFERLVRIIWQASRGAGRGYGWKTVLYVAMDEQRDTGFLLQGIRGFSGLSESERASLLAVRMVGSLSLFVAVLWIPLAFTLSLAGATRGWLETVSIWWLTLGVGGFLVFAGVAARVTAAVMARRSRKKPEHLDAQLSGEAINWNAQLGKLEGQGLADSGATGKSRAFRLGALVVAGLAALTVIPASLLSIAGAVGPVLSSVAVPGVISTTRMAAAEVARRYRLPADPDITPLEAGEALHALGSVGRDRVIDGLKPPAREYPDPWFPPGIERPLELNPRDPKFDLFRQAISGFSRGELEYLSRVAQHPALGEFSITGRAAAADVNGARYLFPTAEGTTIFQMPLPPLGTIRAGAQAHIAAAALDLSQGRWRDAEIKVQEVISTGFLMIDEGTFLLEGLLGSHIVRLGTDALVNLYRATGRSVEAESMKWAYERATAVAERAGSGSTSLGVAGSLKLMRRNVLDPNLPRALRWEYFTSVGTFAPCLNLHSIVFGLGGDYEEWLRSARNSLVRYGSDGALFDLVQHGPFGTGGCGLGLGEIQFVQSLGG